MHPVHEQDSNFPVIHFDGPRRALQVFGRKGTILPGAFRFGGFRIVRGGLGTFLSSPIEDASRDKTQDKHRNAHRFEEFCAALAVGTLNRQFVVHGSEPFSIEGEFLILLSRWPFCKSDSAKIKK